MVRFSLGSTPDINYFYFFSSNSRPLYLQNMLNALALPYRSIHRVRYDSPLVPGYLQLPAHQDGAENEEAYKEAYNKKLTDLKQYQGSPTLVTFVTRERDCKEETTNFYPLRFGKLVKLQWENKVLYADYEVGHYVDWTIPEPYDFKLLAVKRSEKGFSQENWRPSIIQYLSELVATKFVSAKPSAEQQASEREWINKWLDEQKWQTFLKRLKDTDQKDVSDGMCARFIEGLLYNILAAKYSRIMKSNLSAEEARPCGRFISRVVYPGDQYPTFVRAASAKKASEAWQAIVEVISGLSTLDIEGRDITSEVKEFTDTIFYRVTGMNRLMYEHILNRDWRQWRKEDPVRRKPIPIVPNVPGGNGYELRSGDKYELELSFYHSKTTHGSDLVSDRILGRSVVPKLDKTYFSFEPQPIPVTFRYDRRSISLLTTPAVRESFTTLTIEADPPKEDEKERSSQAAPEPGMPGNFLLSGEVKLGLTVQTKLQIPEKEQGQQSGNKKKSDWHSLAGPRVDLVLKLKIHRARMWAILVLIVATVLTWFGTNLVSFSSAPPATGTQAMAKPEVVSGRYQAQGADSIKEDVTRKVSSTGLLTAPTSFFPLADTTRLAITDTQKILRPPFPTNWIIGDSATEEAIKALGLSISLAGSLLTVLGLYLFLGKVPGT